MFCCRCCRCCCRAGRSVATTGCEESLLLDREGASVHGGALMLLGPGDPMGEMAFFTETPCLEVRGGGGVEGEYRGWGGVSAVAYCAGQWCSIVLLRAPGITCQDAFRWCCHHIYLPLLLLLLLLLLFGSHCPCLFACPHSLFARSRCVACWSYPALCTRHLQTIIPSAQDRSWPIWWRGRSRYGMGGGYLRGLMQGPGHVLRHVGDTGRGPCSQFGAVYGCTHRGGEHHTHSCWSRQPTVRLSGRWGAREHGVWYHTIVMM